MIVIDYLFTFSVDFIYHVLRVPLLIRNPSLLCYGFICISEIKKNNPDRAGSHRQHRERETMFPSDLTDNIKREYVSE